MELKATANDRRHLALSRDEFRGPRSSLCRSGGISNNNNRLALVFKNQNSSLLINSCIFTHLYFLYNLWDVHLDGLMEALASGSIFFNSTKGVFRV
ncbi:hypothetical protein TNCV_1471081 [Trichonephila clavipes]|nr:hypothetical protein TNCV_1471081 [Trichonephila clavipes]